MSRCHLARWRLPLQASAGGGASALGQCWRIPEPQSAGQQFCGRSKQPRQLAARQPGAPLRVRGLSLWKAPGTFLPGPPTLPAAASAASSQRPATVAGLSLSHRNGLGVLPPLVSLANPRGHVASPRAATSAATSSPSPPGTRLFDALLVDVGGTLLETAAPVPCVYAEFGRKHGVEKSEEEIKAGFRRAFSTPWPRKLRYEGTGEDFWRYAVATAMGSESEALFQDLYQHFSHGEAWRVADGAREVLVDLRDAGVKLAVVSNFDVRLRPILRDLAVDVLFDSIVVSCEVRAEKPDPVIFLAALNDLGIENRARVVHLGDDPTNDVLGAKALGMEAWLWKKDVECFRDVRVAILTR